MDILEVVKMYNEEGKNLVEIGEVLGTSKSSLSRLLAKEGYSFDKASKKYIHLSENEEKSETINTGNNENVKHEINNNVNNVSRETIKTTKCTFELPVTLHRKLKAKCALEGVHMVDFICKLVEDAVK